MERTRSLRRFSAHTPDDGHLAAKLDNKDFRPLIKIIDAALQKEQAQPTGQSPVLYLKQDKDAGLYFTTLPDSPRQHPAEHKPTLQRAQQDDAAMRLISRASHWMNKQDTADVQTHGHALIECCVQLSISTSGMCCTPVLRLAIQNLHDALNPPAPSADTVPKRKGSTELLHAFRRSLTNKKIASVPNSPVSSPRTSPVKPRGPQDPPRTVHFAEKASEVHSAQPSPRKPVAALTLSPRLPHSAARGPGTKPPLTLTRSQGHLARPLRPPTPTNPSAHNSSQNTPDHTPRKADEH